MGTTGNNMACTGAMWMHTATTSMFDHDHLPLDGGEEGAFVAAVNSNSTDPIEFAGGDMHSHTITLTAEEITTLAGGGMITGKVTDPDDSEHTHTYTISCA